MINHIDFKHSESPRQLSISLRLPYCPAKATLFFGSPEASRGRLSCGREIMKGVENYSPSDNGKGENNKVKNGEYENLQQETVRGVIQSESPPEDFQDLLFTSGSQEKR
jgi:hypothetical protein